MAFLSIISPHMIMGTAGGQPTLGEERILPMLSETEMVSDGEKYASLTEVFFFGSENDGGTVSILSFFGMEMLYVILRSEK